MLLLSVSIYLTGMLMISTFRPKDRTFQITAAAGVYMLLTMTMQL